MEKHWIKFIDKLNIGSMEKHWIKLMDNFNIGSHLWKHIGSNLWIILTLDKIYGEQLDQSNVF